MGQRAAKRHGARQQFIEPIEPRLLLTVFAQDYSFAPPPTPPSLPASSSATPISKGRYIVSTASGGGEDDEITTYTRVFADGSPDKSFGKNGSLSFDVDDEHVTFTGSRFVVTFADLMDAELSVYTINGKPDESVGGGTGDVTIPFNQPSYLQWDVGEADLQHTYADGSMLIDVVIYSEDSVDGPSDCQLLKLNADGTLDDSFANHGVYSLPTGFSGAFRDLTIADDAIYVHVLDTGSSGKAFDEKLLRLTPNGKTDTTFGNGGEIDLDSEFPQYGEEPDGKVIVLNDGIDSPKTLQRFNHDGTSDKTFGQSGSVAVQVNTGVEAPLDAVDENSFYVDSQNRIVVGSGGSIFRFSSTGKLDSYPFNGTAPFDAYGVTEDAQGRILTTSGQGIPERYALVQPLQLDANGVAHITGTIGNDSVTVSRISNDRYQFVVNGQTFDLSAPRVKEIDVNFFNGDNLIDIDSSVDASANVQTLGGDDTVTTSHGDDTIDTGAGSDTIDCGDGNDSITTDDDLNAGHGSSPKIHHITGGNGNKTIETGGTSLFMNLGVGNSKLSIDPPIGGDGSNSVHVAIAGGSNTLTLYSTDAHVTIGGNGNNSIEIESGNSVHLTTGDGNDTIKIDDAQTTVLSGGGNDVITDDSEGSVSDYFSGGGGNDIISTTNEGNSTILGGAGNDSLQGGPGDDYLSGNDGRDTIHGGDGNDSIYGGANSDWLYSENGNDLIKGQGGNDHIFADYPSGKDTLEGGPGNDRFVTTDKQPDSINGGDGNDTANADKSDSLTSVEN